MVDDMVQGVKKNNRLAWGAFSLCDVIYKWPRTWNTFQSNIISFCSQIHQLEIIFDNITFILMFFRQIIS